MTHKQLTPLARMSDDHFRGWHPHAWHPHGWHSRGWMPRSLLALVAAAAAFLPAGTVSAEGKANDRSAKLTAGWAESRSATIAFKTGKPAVVTINTIGSGVVRITAPNGTPLKKYDTLVTYFTPTRRRETFTIRDPVSEGVVATLESFDPTATKATVDVNLNGSKRLMPVITSQFWQHLDRIGIAVRLEDNGAAVADPQAKVTVDLPLVEGGRQRTLPLKDFGGFADGARNDGTYGMALMPKQKRSYQTKFVYEGQDGQYWFKREVEHKYWVVDDNMPTFADTPMITFPDSNGDGLLDSMHVRFKVRQPAGGPSEIRGTLVDAHDRVIQDGLSVMVTGTSGDEPINVDLYIEGGQFHRAGHDGPFVLRDLRIWLPEEKYLCDAHGDVKTDAVAVSRFERPRAPKIEHMEVQGDRLRVEGPRVGDAGSVVIGGHTCPAKAAGPNATVVGSPEGMSDADFRKLAAGADKAAVTIKSRYAE